MNTKTTIALALASLLTIGGTAMAKSSHQRANADWSQSRNSEVYNARAQAPRPFYGQANDAYDAYAPSRGSFGASNQPNGFGNPSLFDRAKGDIY